MIESNSLIKASAGTGKTFALATRFIRQMMIDKVDPRTIVALTFSRAAAQEIYTKILTRLCAAARDAQHAEREWQTLLEDFREGLVPQAAEKLAAITACAIPHAAEDFGRLLRALADTQHLGAIATLDSFILRIVRNFPKEMGFQNAVEVLDPFDENIAVEEAVRNVLSRSDGSGEVVARAFVQAKDGEYSRTCLSAISHILNKSGWRNFVIGHPESKDWTVESMCAALGVPCESPCPDLSLVNTEGRYNPAEKFVAYVRAYTGDGPVFPSDTVKNMMLALWQDDQRTDYGWTTEKGQVRRFEYGAEGAAAIRAGIVHMMNLLLKHQLEIVKAKIDLVKAVEASYERLTRRAGKLTFNDFTKFSAENEFSERGIAIQNVQFRFDSKFDHWALDEFQDTSELQWKCLKMLVKEVADAGYAGESRSAMAVGDLKQSIYTWRGASARPFEQLAGWEAFSGCVRDFKFSHRYGPNIVAFVNKVFGRENVTRGGIIPSACDAAVEDWSAGWVDHFSNEAPDYVKVIGAKRGADSEEDEILPALHAELQALWDRHLAAKSKDTVGILVRNNSKGLEVAEYLRGKGLPVVWEGMSPVHDLPVIDAVLALLRLGDHPEDGYARQTVDTLFEVRKLLLPDCSGPAAVSAAVSRRLSQQGLARTLKDFCGILREKGGFAPNGLSCERLKQLVEMGVDYESRATGGDIDGFVRFLSENWKREIAVSSDVIRILTIHRSKGLGIDHVFVPIFEGKRATSAIDAPTVSTPLYDGGAWVLSHLPKDCVAFNPKTSAAYEAMRSDRLKESLRTYYVALTRSKKSLYVVFPDDSNPADYDKGLLMRDLIVTALGGRVSFEAGDPPAFASSPEDGAAQRLPVRPAWEAKGRRRKVECCSPSKAAHENGRTPAWMRVSNLFDAEYGAAALRGVDVHAAYQKIEWADAETAGRLPPAFREAFVRPSPEASVWRERAYELFDGVRWETGQFDRVVFAGSGSARTATIYDFKTNARRPDEGEEAFSDRMRDLYAPQMAAYRKALARLTGLPEECIMTKLLLETTGAAVLLAD